MKPGAPWPGNQVLSPQVPLQLHEKRWVGKNTWADGLRTRVRVKSHPARRPEAGQGIALGRNRHGTRREDEKSPAQRVRVWSGNGHRGPTKVCQTSAEHTWLSLRCDQAHSGEVIWGPQCTWPGCLGGPGGRHRQRPGAVMTREGLRLLVEPAPSRSHVCAAAQTRSCHTPQRPVCSPSDCHSPLVSPTPLYQW